MTVLCQGGPVLDLPSRLASLRRVRQRADEQFVRIERAYRVLSDPIKRQVGALSGLGLGLVTLTLNLGLVPVTQTNPNPNLNPKRQMGALLAVHCSLLHLPFLKYQIPYSWLKACVWGVCDTQQC